MSHDLQNDMCTSLH